MKRFFVAAVFCFALAALTGCTRHGPDCGVDSCVYEQEKESAVRSTESDLVILDNVPDSIDGVEETAAAKEADPVVVPETPETMETAEAPEEPAAPEAEEDFSAGEMAQKIREIEASTENEPQIIQGIIDEGYGDVPAIVSEAPALNVEILPAEAAEVDYASYLDIEVYDAEEPAAEEAVVAEAPAVKEVIAETEPPALPAVIEETAIETPAPPAMEPVIAEMPEAPAVEIAIETPAAKPAQDSFLLPPPLSAAPEPGPAAFAAEVEPDRSETAEELTLEGLDDMELEFFGSISESLL